MMNAANLELHTERRAICLSPGHRNSIANRTWTSNDSNGQRFYTCVIPSREPPRGTIGTAKSCAMLSLSHLHHELLLLVPGRCVN